MDKDKNGKLLNDIYKNVTMGYESLEALEPKIKESSLKTDIELQKKDYNTFITRAENLATDYKAEIKPENFFVKKSAELGINMHTMFDASASKIAEMVIQGSTMGIIEMTRSLNENTDCDSKVKQVANDIVNFERNNVERLKNYL